ncbi:unnamed protein product, partial [Medioppia subpectinata]
SAGRIVCVETYSEIAANNTADHWIDWSPIEWTNVTVDGMDQLENRSKVMSLQL